MSAIGGFLPLEIGGGGPSYHAGAAALASGRACWHVVVRTCRPRRVRVPFYICDAALAPLRATGTPFELYAIDERFRPTAGVEPGDGELMLVVNYFGVQTALVDAMASADPDRIVVDDTQAFFRRGRPGAWSFNSVRKFFGVPDGGFLYGPAEGVEALPPSDTGDCEHLLTRLAGDDERAWQQFKAHEARIGIEPRAMATVSSRLLAAADVEGARHRRRLNFEALHRRLSRLNTIALPLQTVACEGPMCYPFLPADDVDRSALARAGAFVATLWPEIAARPDAGYEWERTIARRLLPLPVDHRYTADDMTRLADTIAEVV
jgi:hypothetical protein